MTAKTIYFALLFSLLQFVSFAQNITSDQSISFLQPVDAQHMPSEEILGLAMIALEKNSLGASHIATITRGFAYSYANLAAQNALLLKIYTQNKDLAETLIIFRKQLRQAISEETTMQQAIETVFMHYVVNTDNGYAVKGKPTTTEFKELLTRYARLHGVNFSVSGSGPDRFHLADSAVSCESCGQIDFFGLRAAGITVNKIRYGRPDVIPPTAFDFNGKGYTLENAAILAEFSNLSYFDPEFIKKQLALRGFSSFKWIKGERLDTEVFLSQKGNYQIICFRGTSSVTDILTDLKFNKKQAFGGNGKVHAGFQNALNEVWDKLETSIDKNKKVIVTGHSLGGGLAQLLAYRLTLKNYTVSGVYTYGSPRVGNSDFKAAYDARLAKKTFLHTSDKDLVPAIPPEIMGFVHLGDLERKFMRGHKITALNTAGKAVSLAKDLTFEQLAPEVQEKLRIQMDQVAKSVKRSSAFLRINPHETASMGYGTDFETGQIDEHSIDEYLFKLACAIVEREMNYVKN